MNCSGSRQHGGGGGDEGLTRRLKPRAYILPPFVYFVASLFLHLNHLSQESKYFLLAAIARPAELVCIFPCDHGFSTLIMRYAYPLDTSDGCDIIGVWHDLSFQEHCVSSERVSRARTNATST